LVVVDGAHDFVNALEDLKLAMTANPEYIFIDDINGQDVLRAWIKFYEMHGDRIAWFYKVDYPDGGLVVKTKSLVNAAGRRPPGPIGRFFRRRLARVGASGAGRRSGRVSVTFGAR
jgi:hypothetical protein